MHDENAPSQGHDALFRAVFGDAAGAADLLRAVLPPALAFAIDWASLAPEPGSFVDDELRGHHADLLFTATAGPRRVLLYLLLEHKSVSDRWTAFQLLRYVVRILERWRREHPGTALLPPVLPFVLHHGEHAWRAPRTLRGLFDLRGAPPELAALQPDLGFVLEDLAARSEMELRSLGAGAASVLALLHLRMLRRVRRAAALLLQWRSLYSRLAADDAPRAQQMLAQLVSYVAARADDPPHELAAAFATIHPRAEEHFMPTADILRQEGRQRGLAEGQVQGRREGLRIALRTLIASRFGPPDSTVEATLAAADGEQLERWIRGFFAAASLDELLR